MMLRRPPTVLLAWLLPLLLLASTAAPITAQAEELNLEAVEDFKRYYREKPDAADRVEAVMTLQGNECVPAAIELIKLLDDRVLDIRRAAMQVISGYKKPETFAGLVAELPDLKDAGRRALLIEVLGRAGARQAVPVICDIAINDKGIDAQVKSKIAEALGRLGQTEASSPALAVLLGDSDPQVRIQAVEAAGDLGAKQVGDQVAALLTDKYWQVQAAAIEAVGKIRVESAIDPLIALMREGGRFKTETADALFLITTRDFGARPDQWEKSVKSLREMGWKMPTDAEVAKAKAARKRNAEYYGFKEGQTTFAKITTTSTRVLFIIDISGSMEDHVVEKEKFDAGYDDMQKLTIVKTELMNTIDALDRNTYFNVVAFASKVKPWKKDLVAANVVSKSTAKNWVKRLRPLGGSEAAAMSMSGLSSDLSEGRTNTFAALMYPFNIDPEKEINTVFTGGSSRALIKNKLDTVFFLSDGRPSTGRFTETGEILREIRQINKVYQMVFHTIAIGNGDQKEFLRELAMITGGEFVDLGS